jgi:LmbE family N-acetylglucosaminyl deacetylase
MSLPHKIRQRLTDPVFYQKKSRDLLRPLRRFADQPKYDSLDCGPFSEIKKVLLVVAHPDDEVFCSGLLIQLIERGCEVNVACLTKGEGGPTGKSATREELGKIREQEMRESCRILGVKELTFLGHIDPVAKGYRVFAPAISSRDLAKQLSPLMKGVDLLISHGSDGEYWHAAHLLVFSAARQVRGTALWLTMLARQPEHPMPELVNWDDEADLSLDVSGQSDKRLEVIECHRSQLALFERFCGGSHVDFIRKTNRENYSLK